MSVPAYLLPGVYIDSDARNIITYAKETTSGIDRDIDRAVALYYRIRDDFSYSPYVDYNNPDVFRASWTLDQKVGFCISKGAILAACARVLGIPARLGFADVKNHVTSERLRKFIGSDIMPWHAYTELFLERKWVKATPAFNLGLCRKFRIKPLEFDGRQDSIFHPFTEDGDKHMEYIRDLGSYADVPLNRIMTSFRALNPSILMSDFLKGDFAAEGAAEAGG
ncbi:Transglutaminase-like domain [hydrothermal vent metagenome]|uniref:Transglutaminase-like domain n=1 Tax=hydrothermal vent metagenome TaxID=652676 RepID=A0A3B0SSJ8_9ZZZZ